MIAPFKLADTSSIFREAYDRQKRQHYYDYSIELNYFQYFTYCECQNHGASVRMIQEYYGSRPPGD